MLMADTGMGTGGSQTFTELFQADTSSADEGGRTRCGEEGKCLEPSL